MKEEKKSFTIKDWALDDRPREKMLTKGVSALSNAELMGILIGSGTTNETAVDIAQRILSSAGNNLNELGKFSLKDLMKIKGIGIAKAVTILAALELGRRRKHEDALSKKQITSSLDVVEFFQPLIADLPNEEFWVLLLNQANRVIEKVKISEGGINATVVDIRMIMKVVIEYQALGIVLCHNHPSGNPTPSDHDKKITQKLKDAATLLDIKLLDHVIITDSQCFSFADSGIL